MLEELALRVTKARRRVGETQLAFAKRLHVSQPCVSDLEHGGMPKLPLYARLVPLLEEIERGEHDHQSAAS